MIKYNIQTNFTITRENLQSVGRSASNKNTGIDKDSDGFWGIYDSKLFESLVIGTSKNSWHFWRTMMSTSIDILTLWSAV